MKRFERFLAENANEMIWIRLRRLTSYRLCRNVIAQTAGTEGGSLSENILREKSEGMAWAIKSAIGYWDTESLSLNSRILSRYYAILLLSIAEQVASPEPELVLPAIQRHTELGHGLASFPDNIEEFPKSYFVGCLNSGHFNSYCKYLNYDLSRFCLQRRPKRYSDLEEQEREKILSLSDLLRRIPEFQEVTAEYLEESPLSFVIGERVENPFQDSLATRADGRQIGPMLYNAPREETEKLTSFTIFNMTASQYSPEQMQQWFRFENMREEYDEERERTWVVADFRHPLESDWKDYFRFYKSSFCSKSIIAPMWGSIDDPFIIHFATLYALSIVVRYLPNLWHEIEEGDLDHLRSLFEHYLIIIDNVLPRLALERLTRSRILIDHPGSLWGLI